MRVIIIAFSLFSTPLHAAELVLFEFDGCLWCEEWKKDVGTYYHDTAEGKAAPVRVVDLLDKRPEDLRNIRPVRATPTFVLVEDGRELGRIIGYSNAKSFWVDFGKIISETTD